MRNPNSKRESRFCFACGTKTRWVLREGENRPVEVCPSCGQVHFRNSKPCAGALIINNGDLLFVRRNIEPFEGFWDIPGGFLEEGEHPENGAKRETLEETGLDIELKRMLGIYMENYYGEGGGATMNIYYIAEPVSGDIIPGDDASEARWFSLDDPPEKIAFSKHVMGVLADLKRALSEGKI